MDEARRARDEAVALRTERDGLREQFNGAMAIAERVESVVRENQELAEELARARLETNALESKVELLVRARVDIDAAGERERCEVEDARRVQRQAFERELADVKETARQKAVETEKENRRMGMEVDALTTKLQEIDGDAKRTIKHASAYFRRDFDDLGELAMFLEKACSVTDPGRDRRRAKKYKSQVKQLRTAKHRLEAELARLERNTVNVEDVRRYKVEIEQKDAMLRDMSRQVTQLQAQAFRVKEPLRREIVRPLVIGESPPAVRVVKNSVDVEELEEKLRKMTKEMKQWKEKARNAIDNEKRMERENEDLKTENQRMRAEAVELQMKIQVKENEVTSAKAVLEEQKRRVEETQDEVQNVKEKLKTVTKLLETKETENRTLQHEKDEAISAVETRLQTISNLREKVEKKSAKIEELKNEMEKMEAQRPKQEDQVSPVILKCSFFEREVTEAIDDVIASGLTFEAKLQSIYKTIHTHFVKKLAESNNRERQLAENNELAMKKVSQFLSSASVLLSVRQITADDFFAKDGVDVLVQAVSDMRARNDELNHAREALLMFIRRFQETFHLEVTIDATCILSQIEELKSLLQLQKKKLTKRTKLCKKLKCTVREMQEKQQNRIYRLKSEKKILQKELAAKSAELTEVTMIVQKQQRKIRSFTEQDTHEHQDIAAYEDALTKLRNELAISRSALADRENAIIQLKTETREAQTTLENKLKTLKTKYKERGQEVETLSSNLHSCEKAKAATKARLAQLEQSNEKLQQELAETKADAARIRKISESTTRSQICAAEANCATRIQETCAKLQEEKRHVYAFLADQFRDFFNPSEPLDERSIYTLVARVKHELQHKNCL